MFVAFAGCYSNEPAGHSMTAPLEKQTAMGIIKS